MYQRLGGHSTPLQRLKFQDIVPQSLVFFSPPPYNWGWVGTHPYKPKQVGLSGSPRLWNGPRFVIFFIFQIEWLQLVWMSIFRSFYPIPFFKVLYMYASIIKRSIRAVLWCSTVCEDLLQAFFLVSTVEYFC